MNRCFLDESRVEAWHITEGREFQRMGGGSNTEGSAPEGVLVGVRHDEQTQWTEDSGMECDDDEGRQIGTGGAGSGWTCE